jgi:hypothetical protein
MSESWLSIDSELLGKNNCNASLGSDFDRLTSIAVGQELARIRAPLAFQIGQNLGGSKFDFLSLFIRHPGSGNLAGQGPQGRGIEQVT